MKFYHGTNEYGWKETKEQGFLLHKRGKNMSPCTYLTPKIKEAEHYGNIILQVNYNPKLHPNMNNYIYGAWQIRVYEPIFMSDIYLYKIIDLLKESK